MSYLRYVASATRAAAGGSRSEPDRYRSGHTRQGCHLHTNHRTSYLPPYVNADSGDWRGCALIVFNIYGDGRALNRSAQRTLVCCMRLPIRELAAGGQRSWPLTIRPYLCKLSRIQYAGDTILPTPSLAAG